jgi:hypothetical protein
MAASFPSSVKTFVDKTVYNTGFPFPSTTEFKSACDEITAIETALLTTGQIPVGVTDFEAWSSSYSVFEFGASAFVAGKTTKEIMLVSNLYTDNGSAWKYKENGYGAILYLYNGALHLYTAGSGTANNTATLTDVFNIDNSGNVYIALNCSFLSYTDRTPFYEGDAVKEIKAIKGKNKEIDHSTLPEFVKTVVTRDITSFGGTQETKEITTERNVGNMVSMLTVAIQQLTDRIEKLENKSEKEKTEKKENEK